MPRTTTPPVCGDHTDDEGRKWKGCGAPGAWAYLGASKRHARWFFIDAGDMTPAERLGKHPYDESIHVRHRCANPTPWTAPAPSASPGPAGISERVYLAGRVLPALIAQGRNDSPTILGIDAAIIVSSVLAELERSKP